MYEGSGSPGRDAARSLPSPKALAALYERYRALYFDVDGTCVIPAATEVRIDWSSRLSASAGICYPKRRVIRLSTHYHARFPDDVGPTLLHEMIHLVVPGHGPPFARWVERITALGGRVYRYSKAPAAPPKWVYRCRGCGQEIFRRRRLPHGGNHHCCSRCGPRTGRLEERPAESQRPF